jgi:hypothetical protein
MANLVNFNVPKFLGLRSSFDLRSALHEAYRTTGSSEFDLKESFLRDQTDNYQKFIENIVQEVKNCPKKEFTYCVNLKKYNQYLPTPHLTVVAQALYRSYGIEIKQVDTMTQPTKMVVSWNHDHPLFKASVEYREQARHDGYLTDYTLKLPGKDFSAHKLVLASQMPYFDRLFRGEFKDAKGIEHVVGVEGVEIASFEFFLHYVYTGDLNFQGQSSKTVCDLVGLAEFYQLSHVKQKCFEVMCQTINVDNFSLFIDCGTRYGLDELVLIEYVMNEVKPANLWAFIEMAREGKHERFESMCLSEILNNIAFTGNMDETNKLLQLSQTFDLVGFRNGIDASLAAFCRYLTVGYSLLTECLGLACQYSLAQLQGVCQQKIVADTFAQRKMSLDEIEGILVIARQYKLQSILDVYERILLSRIEQDRDKIAVFAQKFDLPRLKEAFKKC